MNLDDHQAPKTFADAHAPRARASQDIAKAHRARPIENDERPTTTTPALRVSPLVFASGAMLLLLTVIALTWPHPGVLPTSPTDVPERALAAPTRTPVLASPTLAPSATPAPAETAPAPADSAPQVGQSLAIDVAPPPPPTAPPIPTFDSVAFARWQQATHVAIFQTAAANGIPGGVVPLTPTPTAVP